MGETQAWEWDLHMCSIIMSLCGHQKEWKDWVPLNFVMRMLTASLTDSCVRGRPWTTRWQIRMR